MVFAGIEHLMYITFRRWVAIFDASLRPHIQGFPSIEWDSMKMSTDDAITNAGCAMQELKMRFFRFAAEPDDPQEERVRKVIGLAIVLCGIPTYLIYGLLYLAFDEPWSGYITAGGAVFYLLGLVSYGVFRHYRTHWLFFMVVGTSIFVSLHFLLGGFATSGMVIIWLLIAPLMTIVADKPRHGFIWAIMIVLLMVVVALADSYVRPGNNFPPAMVTLLSTFNVLGLGTYMLLAFCYYVWRIDVIGKMVMVEREGRMREIEKASRYKSEFLANMSHELRTPLNAVLGFSEALDERYFGDLNDKQAEYVKDIHSSGRHLLSLINDILDLSKIEAGRMELELSKIDLPAALADAITLVKERAIRHGIDLVLEVPADIDCIHADARKFKQIMLNLLSNAVKFTPDGGKVAVRAQYQGNSVWVSVSDTGTGISVEDQEAVFEEFKQVGGDSLRNAEGTGLGLPLAKRFVELHGGTLWLESVPGEGATFNFKLPIRSSG
ncbi:MAG: HAMP domain-containing sensor histidine kinase [Betaproteobacteria bacterium]